MDKNKALESALAQIERSYGKGSVMKLDKKNLSILKQFQQDPFLLIGPLELVVSKGRIIEVYGPESSGKNNTSIISNCSSPKKRWNMCIH